MSFVFLICFNLLFLKIEKLIILTYKIVFNNIESHHSEHLIFIVPKFSFGSTWNFIHIFINIF